jgi:hypothetical protein
MNQRAFVIFSSLVLCFAVACKHDHDHDGHDHDHSHKEEKKHDHKHTAPHGGALVAVGDHFAMVELTLKPEKGALTLYCLDQEAKKAVIPEQKSIVLEISHEKVSFTLTLTGVASSLTGESKDKTSQFTVTDNRLMKMAGFQAKLKSLKVKGKVFKDLSFPFPKGKDH